MEYNILYKTIHGSRLYGMAKPDSDYDYFTVVDKVKNRRAKYAKHTIVDSLDSNVVDFGTFMNGCSRGVPQYLEAMFSTNPEIDEIADLRAGYRVGTHEVLDRYLRTIKSFSFDEKNPFKSKRHALRLALNFKEIRTRGRFNPKLDRIQIALINSLAELSAENVYNDALAIAWS
jgi:hypothetical protein